MIQPSPPPGVLSFRPITAADEGFLYRVYASTREEELAPLDWTEAQKHDFLTMQFNAQHSYYQEHYPGASFQLILLDGEPAGRLYLDERADEVRVIDIALLPDYRGRGIGSTLMREIIKGARQAGLPVRIHVERFNPAMSLYRRLGFEHIGDSGVYLLMEWRATDTDA